VLVSNGQDEFTLLALTRYSRVVSPLKWNLSFALPTSNQQRSSPPFCNVLGMWKKIVFEDHAAVNFINPFASMQWRTILIKEF
jgi:hypothetical protein